MPIKPAPPSCSDTALLTQRDISRLRWRSRRGLLENDLFMDRFFQRHLHSLTVTDGHALMELMSLSDNDLLDLLLERKSPAEVEPALDRSDIHHLLSLLKEK